MFTTSNIANQFDENDLSSFVPILFIIKVLVLTNRRSFLQQCGALFRNRITQS